MNSASPHNCETEAELRGASTKILICGDLTKKKGVAGYKYLCNRGYIMFIACAESVMVFYFMKNAANRVI